MRIGLRPARTCCAPCGSGLEGIPFGVSPCQAKSLDDPQYDRLHREVFDRVPVGLYRSTPAGEIVDVNPALAQMLGCQDRDALLGEAAKSVYARPEMRQLWMSKMEAAGTVSGFVSEWICQDGRRIWVEENAHAVRDADGTVLYYDGSAQDVTVRCRAEMELAEEKARFEQLFAAAPEAIVLCANEGTVLRVNEAFSSLFGYSPDEVVGRDIDDIVAAGRHALRAEARRITDRIAEGRLSFVETRRQRKDGSFVHVSILAKPVLMERNQIALYAIYRDITAQKEAEAALAESHRKVEELHAAAHALAGAQDEDAVYRTTCEAAERVLGFSLGVLCIAQGNEFICQAVSSEIEIESLGRTPIDPQGVGTRVLASGQPVIVNDPEPRTLPFGVPPTSRSLLCAPIGHLGIFQAASPQPGHFTAEDGRLLAILLGHTAVNVERLRLQQELVRQARHDALTGVFNRRYFNEYIAQEVLRSTRYDHPIGLLMIDVNRFKEINDRYGHQTGDMVLREIAVVLTAAVRQTDMVVRYGGDEFLVVLTETGDEAEEAARRVRAAVRGSDKLREISGFDVTVSVGHIFWRPDTGTPIEEALAAVDARMYDDKRSGGHGRS